MNKFSFNVYKQSRVLVGLFVLPFLLFISIFLGVKFDSFLVLLIGFIISFFFVYYYAFGHITITFKDERLYFNWKKKIIFNYKEIKTTRLDDIKIIVIDEGKLLKKIKTSDRIIYINNSKRSSPEAYNFINHLRKVTEQYNPEIIDSWDEFAKKGYLKLAYRINTFIIILSIVLAIVFILLKGFKPHFLFILLLFIPQMLLYKQQMKDKLKKNK